MFKQHATKTRWLCWKCSAEHVTARRKKIKEVLVSDAGGACVLCGYSRSLAALQFHHLVPESKSRVLSNWSGSLEAAKLEAKKCVLLCANCHAEVECGLATLRGLADKTTPS